MENSKKGKKSGLVPSKAAMPEPVLPEETQPEEILPEPDPDIDRFIELYASFGVPLRKQKKDGMYRILITDVYSEKFKFTPEAGCVVWFELDGTFARQIFYAK